jgi:hypothetical protein
LFDAELLALSRQQQNEQRHIVFVPGKKNPKPEAEYHRDLLGVLALKVCVDSNVASAGWIMRMIFNLLIGIISII